VQVSIHDGKHVVLSGVPGEADQQRTQLNGMLTAIDMTADTEGRVPSREAEPGSLSLELAVSSVERARDGRPARPSPRGPTTIRN
jgi:hypothetical protein